LLVERALSERCAPRSVVYLALDLLEGQSFAELARTVRRAKELAGDGRALLLLDEVTSVTGWQTAVKALWDEGSIDKDVVVCTGSSAIDLRHGTAERLPGRRGTGTDHLVLPQSFAAFARAVDPSIPAPPGLSIDELRSEAGTALLHDVRLHHPALERKREPPHAPRLRGASDGRLLRFRRLLLEVWVGHQ
jgi:predicted AAA+ superfamily ATPase